MNDSSIRLRLATAMLLGSLLPASPALPAQGQEASIIGQIKDESGAILPGVTVTASPALQVEQVTTVTTSRASTG
jgi:hypothetical protein